MEELLIEKVREHEVIYNVNSSDYRDQHVRQTAWEKIAKELNISASEAKERWDKLRRCFCNARNRRRLYLKSGTTYKKKSLWKYEQEMEFLTPFLESRKAYSNLSDSHAPNAAIDTENNIPTEGYLKDETSFFSTKGEDVNLDTRNEQDVQSYETASDNESSIGVVNVGKNYQRSKKIRYDTPAYQMVRFPKENSDPRERKYEEKNLFCTSYTKTRPFETLDEMDMFFLSMSRMTKKMPKLCQAQIKLEVSNAVLSAEIRHQQQLSPPPNAQNSLQTVQQHTSCSSTASPNPSNIQTMT